MPDLPPCSAPYRTPAAVIAALCAQHDSQPESQRPGERPLLKWLAARSGLSVACASTHRRAYYGQRAGRRESRARG